MDRKTTEERKALAPQTLFFTDCSFHNGLMVFIFEYDPDHQNRVQSVECINQHPTHEAYFAVHVGNNTFDDVCPPLTSKFFSIPPGILNQLRIGDDGQGGPSTTNSNFRVEYRG